MKLVILFILFLIFLVLISLHKEEGILDMDC
jgi:hypothetical protein